MKMRAVIFLALLVVCQGGYPAALPEVVVPSNDFGALPEAPVDSYGPPQSPSDSYGAPVKASFASFATPTKVSVNLEPVQETLSTPAVESSGTEIVAAAPAQSASFNFLPELTAPPLLTLGVAETSLKAAPAVQQESASAPLIEQFQLITNFPPPPVVTPPVTNLPPPPVVVPPITNLPPTAVVVPPPPVVVPPVTNLPPPPVVVPPVTNLPPPPVVVPPVTNFPPPPVVVPPVHVLPPTILPPTQTPFPVPIPVQPPTVQPPPVPVQTLTLGSSPVPAPVTKITAQQITVPRVQTAFIPQENFQLILPSVTPFNYAPYYFHQNTFPAAFLAPRKVLPQLAVAPQLTAELVNLQPEAPNAVVETSVVKTAQNLVEAPSTSYGTPILETLRKKK